MKYKPHDYQAHAIDYILNKPEAALLLDMGLGKTVITLTALTTMLTEQFTAVRPLVIAPLRVARDTWPEELGKWDHLQGLTMAVMVGTAAETGQERAYVLDVNREATLHLAADPAGDDFVGFHCFFKLVPHHGALGLLA